jgi:membrane-bound serine protease (ClpP class)
MATTIGIIVLLILAGLVFILFELLTPTFGPLAVLGLASLAGAGYFAFQVSSLAGIGVTVGMLLGVPVYIVLLVKYLPHTPLGRTLFLAQAPSADAAATPEAPKLDSLVGHVGVAETVLRPSGAVRVDGQRVVAVAESGMIEKGEAVEVIATSGMNVVVRKATAGGAQ